MSELSSLRFYSYLANIRELTEDEQINHIIDLGLNIEKMKEEEKMQAQQKMATINISDQRSKDEKERNIFLINCS